MSRANDVFRALYDEIAGRRPEPDEAEIRGADPALPGTFLVGPAAAACVATTTLSAAELLYARGTKPGQITVDGQRAALAFGSERWLRVDDAPPTDVWAELSGDYRAADGWVRLHCNYPHHARAACRALSVSADRAAVAEAVSLRPAIEIEEGVLAAGGAAAAMRTSAEWRKHPAGRAASATRTSPLVTLDRLDAAPRFRSLADRPLAGVRVLELTHVLAGPVCGRTLAAHGADVLHVGAAHLPTVGQLVIDTGFGKRTTHLDLRTEADRAVLRGLVADADVFVQSFRPDTLAARGFGFDDLARLRPGIVVVQLSAYGHVGPWRSRRGFDSLVQLASGIADDGREAAGADQPVPLPFQALDHAMGWLAAAAVCTALRRQAADGGSWRIRLSLARVAAWLDDLGRQQPGQPVTPTELAVTDSPFGRLTYLPIPGDLPAAPPRYGHAPHLPGSDPAAWW